MLSLYPISSYPINGFEIILTNNVIQIPFGIPLKFSDLIEPLFLTGTIMPINMIGKINPIYSIGTITPLKIKGQIQQITLNN